MFAKQIFQKNDYHVITFWHFFKGKSSFELILIFIYFSSYSSELLVTDLRIPIS